jgi:serine protease Do/serine protease DegQ
MRPLPVLLLLMCSLRVLCAAAGIPPVTVDGKVPTLAPLLEQVTPAVVNIAVLSRSPEQDNPMLRDPFFRRFFGLPETAKPQISAGSGVIVDARGGYVLTNHHVVKDAEQIAVTLKDGRRLQGKLVGSDAATDIALLKVEGDNLKALTLGDSDALRVGDYVMAIGNPFGLGQTVTSGIVSALGRTGLNIEGYEDFIQTDASINPGNSGGALVNLRGELIGINTAIIGPSGASVGIGFAIPSNMARAVMTQLLKFGEVKRGRVGLTTQDLTPELAGSLGVAPATRGAVVVEVAQGSPADKAGLRIGDVVMAVNGRAVRGSPDLRNQIGLAAVGTDVELKLLREGREQVTRLRVEALRATPGGQHAEQVAEIRGLTIANAERNGRPEGVAAVKVEPNSPAWSHGLRPGDLIVAVNRYKVRTTREFLDALRSDGALVLTVVRGEVNFAVILRK